MASLRGIYRDERGFEGWVVKVKRRGHTHFKYFSDGDVGPVESLRAALRYRDRLLRHLGPPTHTSGKNSRNTSGIVGVQREVARTSGGNLAENWCASWIDHTGKRHRRAFSIHKYGEEEARRRAIAARAAGVRKTTAEREKTLVASLDDLVRVARLE